jgi:hypothetical protein
MWVRKKRANDEKRYRHHAYRNLDSIKIFYEN